ncbi:hypothetical protein AHMF7605_05865 [Adhaeribacter arboris]|uniref:Tautomerase enzyme n=1 Tax=Adhaeribacter arboris TaxID=2072846 RepID=A0A2T2YC60_9BACT|nr:hypothetical protein [Adhaeribacter arboris]PSR53084.1 hypothetical protein AHMF7605_05865 [Adhaeribacter arboris]
MPYLKITCSDAEHAQFQDMAQKLTAEIINLFYNPQSRVTREELRQRTTIHFVPYQPDELYIGGQTVSQRGRKDVTVELSDWSMSVKKQKQVAQVLTPVLAQLFSIPVTETDSINIRFHSYSPSDFAIGGKLLSDLVPTVGRIAKSIFG